MARKEINVITGEVTEHADDAPVVYEFTYQDKRKYEYHHLVLELLRI